MTGFEPAAYYSRSNRATKLRHVPRQQVYYTHDEQKKKMYNEIIEKYFVKSIHNTDKSKWKINIKETLVWQRLRH